MSESTDPRVIPDYFRLIYSREAIAERTMALGKEISAWAAEVDRQGGEQLLGICVLRGGVFFFSDLLKSVAYTVEPSFCRCRSYAMEANTQMETFEITVRPEGVAGRRLLLIDDICDSGRTLSNLVRYCEEQGAVEVRSAVLIHRIHEASIYTPDYVGFRYEGEEWFAGYGMEDRNHRANYPDVYLVMPE